MKIEMEPGESLLGSLDGPLRLGIMVQLELGRRPWRPKDGLGTPLSFSIELLRKAGGFQKLITEWEPDV